MSYDREQLRRWSRPEGVLRPDEVARIDEWLELFALMLPTVGAGPEPTIVQKVAARRRAEIVWEFDRLTSSRRDAGAGPSPTIRREDQFEASEYRRRLDSLALEEFDNVGTFAQVAGGAVGLNVVPFEAPAKRAKTG